MNKPTHILIVEDIAADADLAARAIRRVIKDCEIQVVETRKDFLRALEVFQPDVILSDYSLPHFDGMKALELILEHAPLTPLIIWTGSISEDVAVACMKAGANNYVLKENFKRLGPAVIHALEERESLVARRQAEEALRESENRLILALSGAQMSVWEWNLQTNEILWSPEIFEITGIDENGFGSTFESFTHLIHKDDIARVMAAAQKAMNERTLFAEEFRIIRPDGEVRWLSNLGHAEYDATRDHLRLIGTVQDITQRRQNEMELRRHLAELEALYENGLAVGRLLKPGEIGNRVIETFARYLSWHHVAIRLRLELVAFNLPDLKDEERARVEQHFATCISKVGQGISGRVIQTGMPFRTGNVHAHPQYVVTHAGIRSGLYMPLKVGEHVIGVISVESEAPDAFTEQDERLLATLANQAAIAFQNARWYQTVQKELAERKRVEEALRASETHYRALADSITDILFEMDRDLHYTHWNKASEMLTGIPAKDAIGRSVREIFGETDEQKRIEQIFKDVLKDRQPRTFETELVLNGAKRFFEINAYPSTRGVSVVAKDVTERKQMEVALEAERNQLARRVEERTADLSRANANLARALRVKDEFLANMSHELRTPLNAILGLSESLGEQIAGPLNEKQQKYVTIIGESGHHLLSLINDILDLAKIEAGQITLDINKVDIRSVCQASLRMVKQLAQKKNQEVSLEIDKGLGLIWADERRLKQMIVNLLSNAVKFTPENGKLGLEVHGDEAANKVRITVWDHGIGIKEADLARLFQPFMQLDSGLAREATGTGLGLALVAQMARLHGGNVTAVSEPEKGSRFSILLPWEPALAKETVERLRNTGKLRAIKPDQTQKPTILLAEDTEDVILMLKDYLELSGYKVVTAEDGVEALTQARLVRPDLILMDIQLPRMDGIETTRKLREEPDFRYTPIIALTALAMPSDRERCLAAGMDEYISKPVHLKALVKIIQSYLFSHGTSQPR
jgi:PAS domain S-box-containing protein